MNIIIKINLSHLNTNIFCAFASIFYCQPNHEESALHSYSTSTAPPAFWPLFLSSQELSNVLDTFQRPPASWHFRQPLLTAFCLLWTFKRFPASLALLSSSCLLGTFKRPPVSLVLLAASCLPGTFIRPRPSLALRSSEHFLLLSWHFWQPEVLQEASPTSLALLATSKLLGTLRDLQSPRNSASLLTPGHF